MELVKMSPDVQATVEPGRLIVGGVSIREVFRDGGRPVNLAERTEGELYPNTVYAVRTFVGLKGIQSPAQIMVRPSYDSFKRGIEIKRWEVATNGEIIAFMAVLNRMRFERLNTFFEVFMMGTGEEVPVSDFKAPAPPDLKVLHFKETGQVRLQQNMTVAPSDVKRVDDWLNSADVKPDQVGTARPDRPPLVPAMSMNEAILKGPVEARM